MTMVDEQITRMRARLAEPLEPGESEDPVERAYERGMEEAHRIVESIPDGERINPSPDWEKVRAENPAIWNR